LAHNKKRANQIPETNGDIIYCVATIHRKFANR
jgi:hypothetical protein